MFNDIGERRTRSLGARPNLTLHTETFISNNKCIVGGATRYAPGRTLLRPVATRDRETCVVYPRERGTAVRVAVAGSRRRCSPALVNRPSQRRGWSSLARRRRESIGSILIVKCAADRSVGWTACVVRRRSSDRSTASATPQSLPAGDPTTTRNTFRDCIH